MWNKVPQLLRTRRFCRGSGSRRRSSCVWHWKFGEWGGDEENSVICHLYANSAVTQINLWTPCHSSSGEITGRSLRVRDRLILYCGWWKSNAALRTKSGNKTCYWVNSSSLQEDGNETQMSWTCVWTLRTRRKSGLCFSRSNVLRDATNTRRHVTSFTWQFKITWSEYEFWCFKG